jgi:PIN domain nuclease of toxin-antitoxin system
MVVLDTCTLLWRLFEPEALSKRAARLIAAQDVLIVSSISIWEIAVKMRKKQLILPVSTRELVELIGQVEGLECRAVDERIWLEAVELKWPHRDPADRVIVATAKQKAARLVTCDRRIRSLYRKAVW